MDEVSAGSARMPRLLKVVEAATNITVVEHLAGLRAQIETVVVSGDITLVNFLRDGRPFVMEAKPLLIAGSGYEYTIKAREA